MRGHEKRILAGLLLLAPAVLVVSMVSLYRFLDDPPIFTIPAAKMPSPNAYDDYQAAGQMLAANGGTPLSSRYKGVWNTRVPPILLLEARECVSANRKVLARLRQGLKKDCRVPPVYSWMQPLPDLSRFRDLGRLLNLEGMVYQHLSQPGRAAGSYLDGIDMGFDVARGGPVIHKLVETAIAAIVTKPLTDMIRQLPTEDARMLAHRLEALLDGQVPAYQSWENERIATLGGMKDMFDKSNIFELLKSDAQFAGWKTVFSFRGKRRSFYLIDRYFQELIAESRKDYQHARPVEVPKDIYAELLVSAPLDLRRRVDSLSAKLRVVSAEMALRAYRLDHGHCPPSLSALVPAYLKKLPPDPFSGKPLVYRSEGDRYRLYSIGGDLKDNGGQPIPRQPGKSYRDPADRGDITLEW